MRQIGFFILFLTGYSTVTLAQRITPEQYVEQYREIAIREMKRNGVPAAIILAQGILETESGNSDLVKRSNNHFGIKCKSNWNAATVYHDDDEAGECFRAYSNAEDSYRDHSNFLRTNGRYASLFNLDPKDYKGWANGLKKAGYATNPRYPEILIRQIETYQLQQYTYAGTGDIPTFEGMHTAGANETMNVDFTESSAPSGPVQEHAAKNSMPAAATMVSKIIPFSQTNINGSKAIWVPKNTSLLAIAKDNKIKLSRLLEMNDLKKDGLLAKDQYIFLEKKQKEGDKDFYVVRDGEDLHDVAQANGVLLQSLLEINRLSNNIVEAGTKIYLRPQSVATISSFTKTQEVSNVESRLIAPITHEVQPKEGLYSISRKYGVSVSQLKEWNRLQDDHIKIGQRLLISK